MIEISTIYYGCFKVVRQWLGSVNTTSNNQSNCWCL